MNKQNIPAVLKQNALWCVWKRNAENKKIPINPKTGKYGQSDNPDTFGYLCSSNGNAGKTHHFWCNPREDEFENVEF